MKPIGYITIKLSPWQLLENAFTCLRFAEEVNDYELIERRTVEARALCDLYEYDFNECYDYFIPSVTLSDD